MSEQSEALRARTNRFALDVVHLLDLLPNSEPGRTVRRQLANSATSVAASYRASCRARSHAEFTARIALVAEESDEALFWLNFMADASMVARSPVLARLQREAAELTAIFSTSAATARRKSRAALSKRRSS
jgi:four helix bundle protein